MGTARYAITGDTIHRQSEKTLADQAYKRMREDVLGGHLMPGSRLRLTEIQSRYGLGMSPVREAMMRLASEGLIIADGQRGFSVACVSLDELRDVTRTRERIEALAIRDAINHGTADWEADILAAYHRLTHAPLPTGAHDAVVAQAWEARHRDFHQALVAACPSPWVLRLWAQLVDHSERYRRVRLTQGLPPATLVRDIAQEHEDLMKAVISRQADKACALMALHLHRTQAMVEQKWGRQ